MKHALKLGSVAALAIALSACIRINDTDDRGDNAAAQADAAAEGFKPDAAAEPRKHCAASHKVRGKVNSGGGVWA